MYLEQDNNLNKNIIRSEIKKSLQLELFGASEAAKNFKLCPNFIINDLEIELGKDQFYNMEEHYAYIKTRYGFGEMRNEKFFTILFFEDVEHKKNIFSRKRFRVEITLIDFKTFFLFFNKNFSIVDTAKLYNSFKNTLTEFCKEKNINFSINENNIIKNNDFVFSESDKNNIFKWFFETFFKEIRIEIKVFYKTFWKGNGFYITSKLDEGLSSYFNLEKNNKFNRILGPNDSDGKSYPIYIGYSKYNYNTELESNFIEIFFGESLY
jgi:hypothetical protein